MSLFVSYRYTNAELKKALLSIQFPPFSYYLLSAICFLSSIGIAIEIIYLGIRNFPIETNALSFAFIILLFVFSLWLFSISPKHAKEMKRLFSSEQTVSIIGNELTYTVEKHEFTIGTKYIYKIVKNDYFYILKLYITRSDYDYYYKFYSNPQIPINTVQESEIINIAHELKIPYICKKNKIS